MLEADFEFQIALDMIFGEKDLSYLENYFIPNILVNLSKMEFDDGNYYYFYSGNLSSYTYKGTCVEFSINNLFYERINNGVPSSSYFVNYATENPEQRPVLYFNGNMSDKLESVEYEYENIMIKYENLNDSNEFFAISRFVSNLVGKDVEVPIFNNWGHEIMLPIHTDKAESLNQKSDSIFDTLGHICSKSELTRLFSIDKNYMYKHTNPTVDFVLNFSAFDEKMKWEYLKELFGVDKPYDELYTDYNQFIDNKVESKLETLLLSEANLTRNFAKLTFPSEGIKLKGILNRKQTKYIKEGIKKNVDQLNNLPEIIRNFKYKEDLMRLCQVKFLKEGEKEIENIVEFEEIRRYKNQKIWLLYKILDEPQRLTNFRNKYLHTTSVQHDASKLRNGAEVIQLIMYYINLREVEISEEIIYFIYDGIIQNWSGRIIL